MFTTYTVIDVLLIMCLLAFFVTSADKSQLFVYLCYLLIIILPEAICCLGTLNVYVVLLMLLCEQTFMATTKYRLDAESRDLRDLESRGPSGL